MHQAGAMGRGSRRIAGRALTIAAALLALMQPCAFGDAMTNPFHDPFERVTQGMRGCVAPRPPSYTVSAMREEEHWRVEQGNSCYLAGRCRYSNSYLYDAGIARRLKRSLASSPGLRDTSIWILVQGRIVELSGCVASASQITSAEAVARKVRDVQGVITHLMVGVAGSRPYK